MLQELHDEVTLTYVYSDAGSYEPLARIDASASRKSSGTTVAERHAGAADRRRSVGALGGPEQRLGQAAE